MDEYNNSDFPDSPNDFTDDSSEIVDNLDLGVSDFSGDFDTSTEEFGDFTFSDTSNEVLEDVQGSMEDIEPLDFNDASDEMLENSQENSELEILDHDSDDLPEEIAEDSDTTPEEIESLDLSDAPSEVLEDSQESSELEILDHDSDDLPEEIAEDGDMTPEEIESLDLSDAPSEVLEDSQESSELEILDHDSDDLPEEIAEDSDTTPETGEPLDLSDAPNELLEDVAEYSDVNGIDPEISEPSNEELSTIPEWDTGGMEPLADNAGGPEFSDELPLENDVYDTLQEVSDAGDGSAGTDTSVINLSQSEAEEILEVTDDVDSLRQLRDGIASGRIQIDADNEGSSEGTEKGPVLTRDPSVQWEIGNNAIDDTVEAMRDDLRDKGLEDGPEMESIVMTERARMQDELRRNIEGDFSNPYMIPDFNEIIESRGLRQSVEEITEVPEQNRESIQDILENIDYNQAFEGLDSYDFDGIDYSDDTERLDASLENFQSEAWENMELDEQKDAMNGLAEYVEDIIGFNDPPRIVYYNNPEEGDYGGYSSATNTLEVNEYMLYNNEEAADTIAHELWHAYQHERANNPCSEKDYLYQYGFENYIRPEDDFTAYQDQLVEAEARAFAQQFKDRLNMSRRTL